MEIKVVKCPECKKEVQEFNMKNHELNHELEKKQAEKAKEKK